MAIPTFRGSIFHKPRPHEPVMCLPSVKESFDTMATGCWISHQYESPKIFTANLKKKKTLGINMVRCCGVLGKDFFIFFTILGQIHLVVNIECDWSNRGKVSLHLLECTDCRVGTVFSLVYCIKMTFPGICCWRIWKNRVFSCAVFMGHAHKKGGEKTSISVEFWMLSDMCCHNLNVCVCI